MEIFQWIIAVIAIGTLIYNSVVTHAFLRNDIKHLKEDMIEIKKQLWSIAQKLMK